MTDTDDLRETSTPVPSPWKRIVELEAELAELADSAKLLWVLIDRGYLVGMASSQYGVTYRVARTAAPTPTEEP